MKPVSSSSGTNYHNVSRSEESCGSRAPHTQNALAAPEGLQSRSRSTIRMASDGATRSDSFSCAHVAGRPYKVGEHTPDPIRKFLSQSFSNNRYDSEEHLFSRAKNYLEYAGAEKRKLARAQASFQDPASPMIQQAAWMLHLERNSWGTEPGMDNVDRNRVADEVTAAVPYDPSSPYARPPAWLVDPNSTSALSMMIKKEHGPFTLEQTKTAVSTIQEGGLLSDKWKELADRKSHRTAHRHSTVRNGTFPSKTPGGADLSQDPGTRLRDAAGIPGNLSQPLIRAKHQGYPHTFTCFGSAIATALGAIPVLRGLSAPAAHAFAVRGRTCALQAPLLGWKNASTPRSRKDASRFML